MSAADELTLTCSESVEYWQNLPPGPVPVGGDLSGSEEHIALGWLHRHYPEIHAAAVRHVRTLRAADARALKGNPR